MATNNTGSAFNCGSNIISLFKQVPKLLWTQKEVHATVVTSGYCMHGEMTNGSGHALASCYSCCMLSHGLCYL